LPENALTDVDLDISNNDCDSFRFTRPSCLQSKETQTPQQSTSKKTPGDHSQTKALQAAGAVGYDGKQLQKRVDKVLEQKEKRDKDLENELTNTNP